MDIKECKKYSAQKYKGKTRKIVDEQINLFFEIENSGFELIPHSYSKGENVILNKHHFLHGIGSNLEITEFISKNGILSKEATGNFGNHAFQFVVGLWQVKDKINLKDYIENYSGIVANVNDKFWQVPYNQLDAFVEKLRNVDHWKWNAESSMEIRFMPSLARDINQVGFILNLKSDYGQYLLKNDINDVEYNKKISDNFLKKDLRGNFFNNKSNDFLERASYVIFGINKCFIEGIIVGREYEKNNKKLKELKALFPNSYLCNLDGCIIVE